MSLTLAAIAACGIIALAVLGSAAGTRYLRRNKPRTERPPEPRIMRVLYCLVAPVLAFAIVTALIFLLISGPCGLDFGYEQGLIVLAFGGALVPLFAAVLALGFSLRYGRQVVIVECAIAAVFTVVMVVYGVSPHRPTPTTYDSANPCQLQGP